MTNSIKEYIHTNIANGQPIAGSNTPYTVISVAAICVHITAKNRGIPGLMDQK